MNDAAWTSTKQKKAQPNKKAAVGAENICATKHHLKTKTNKITFITFPAILSWVTARKPGLAAHTESFMYSS